MKLLIRFIDGPSEVVDLGCTKNEVAYSEQDGIASVFVRDELVEVINLKAIAKIKFVDGED